MHEMNRVFLAAAVASLVWWAGGAAPAAGQGRFLDPSCDRPGEEWCYLGKSTTVIGVPFQPDVTQITFDGAVFTRSAELCFFYGEGDQPLPARGKLFLEGWLPVVQHAWRDGQIAFDIEYFAAPLEGETADNTVNFVQVRMRNAGSAPAAARFASALRHNGGDYRLGGSPFSARWRYEMTDRAVLRDGKPVYTFWPPAGEAQTRPAAPAQTPARRECVPGKPYAGPFTGADHGLTPRSESCLVRYAPLLGPGESFAVRFTMPRVPTADAAFNRKLASADHAAARARTIAWWTDLFRAGASIEVPEKRFQDAFRAGVVHTLLGTRSRGGRQFQTDGLPYPDFFLTSVPEIAMLYLCSGLGRYAADYLVPQSIAQQQADGLYYDRAVAHGVIIPATQGHILYSIAQTVLFTQDKALAERVYPSLTKAVAFIERTTGASPHGLLPPCYPYDAEMIDGHYTGQNLFALMGLRHAVRVARLLNRCGDAADWARLAERYEASILKALAASAKGDGYIPPGLYDYLTGMKASRKFAEYQTHCDWENMILAWPTEVLPAGDERVRGTLRRVRKGYAEGVMTYRHGMHLHQYITSNMIQQYLARGESYTALKDFYHQLLHSGSTHESFENLVVPWSDRMVDPHCPPPHVWGTAKQALLARMFLLMEQGGRCGLDEGRRELWLFHCLSPAWTIPGRQVAVRNAPTEFGPVTATMAFAPEGAEVRIEARFHAPPAAWRLRMPYFKELLAFETDARQSRREGDCVVLSPDATRIRLQWRDRPGAHRHTVEEILTDYRSANRFAGVKEGNAVIEPGAAFLLEDEKSDQDQPLSFERVRQTFLHEYRRRSEQSRKAGGTMVQVRGVGLAPPGGAAQPPAALPSGWKVSASADIEGHEPALAFDGVVSLASSWQADPYPQWLLLDMGKPVRLKGVHLWMYWGMGRHYRYSIEASLDGRQWTCLADRTANRTPADEKGERFDIPADQRREVRYLRVNVLFHSLNPGVHVVELKPLTE